MPKIHVKSMSDDATMTIDTNQLKLIPEDHAKGGGTLLVDETPAQDFSIYGTEQQVAAIIIGNRFVPVVIDLDQIAELSEPARLAEALPFMLAQHSNEWWLHGKSDYLDMGFSRKIKEADGEDDYHSLDVCASISLFDNLKDFNAYAVIYLNTGSGGDWEVAVKLNKDGTVNADAMVFNEGVTRTMFDNHLSADESFISGMATFWGVAKISKDALKMAEEISL